MLKTIVAIDVDGLDVDVLTIALDVEDGIDIKHAVMDACKEYCLTEDGQDTYDECNCRCFNWADFDAYVPNELCEKHGFRKVDVCTTLEFDLNEQLVDEDDIFPEE